MNGIAQKARLTKYSSVFSSELYAILKSLRYIRKNGNNKFVIYSDSLSAIQSIKSYRNQTSLNIRISDILNKIKKKTIVFEWIPSHVIIAGNELADISAKEATRERNIYRLPLSTKEFNCIINKKIFHKWNKEWRKDGKKIPCHLYKLKPMLGDWKSSYKDNRRKEVVLSRLRTGTCRYLVQHHIKKDKLKPMNKCDQCKVTNSIEHLILYCPKWKIFREQIRKKLRDQQLPFNIVSVLGDQFDHEILYRYLLSTKYLNHI